MVTDRLAGLTDAPHLFKSWPSGNAGSEPTTTKHQFGFEFVTNSAHGIT